MATDGDAVAAHRVAALLREGRVGAPDPEAALHWAERSAILGNADGMRLLARFHADGVGTVPDAEQAEFWDGEADGWATSAARAAAGREVREMRSRIAAVERSAQYRVGDAFVRAIREPGRATLALPSRLWQIYARRPRRVRARRGS
jgi:TPR repeat protein